jgi:hypothetical protein
MAFLEFLRGRRKNLNRERENKREKEMATNIKP